MKTELNRKGLGISAIAAFLLSPAAPEPKPARLPKTGSPVSLFGPIGLTLLSPDWRLANSAAVSVVVLGAEDIDRSAPFEN